MATLKPLPDPGLPWVSPENGRPLPPFAEYMQALDGYSRAAWATYTPTVAARTGALTSYTVNSASYQQIGKTVRGHFDVTITNAGTGSQQLFVSLPVTARSQFQACFAEDFATGKSAGGSISTAGGGDYTKAGFLYYDGNTIIAAGTQLVCNFQYEAA